MTTATTAVGTTAAAGAVSSASAAAVPATTVVRPAASSTASLPSSASTPKDPSDYTRGSAASLLNHTLQSYKGTPNATPAATPAAAAGAANARAALLSPTSSKMLAAVKAGGSAANGNDSDSNSSWTAVAAPSIVARGPEDADLLPLCYGSSVVLRVCTGKFIAVEDSATAPPSGAPSTRRRVHGASLSSWCTFTILNANAGAAASTAEVQFQHSVAFQAPDGTFLSAEAADPHSRSAEEDAPIGATRRSIDDARCRWTLLSGAPDMLAAPSSGRAPPFQRARGGVKIFDRIVLKSALGFLALVESDVRGALVHNTPFTQVGAQCVIRMARSNLPIAPEWVRVRGGALSLHPPTLPAPELAAAAASAAAASPSPADLHTLPPEVQEQLLLEDVLFALLAIEGKFITLQSAAADPSAAEADAPSSSSSSQHQRVQFVCSPAVRDPSLRELVSRLLPVASSYYAIQSFVQSRTLWSSGLVSHALAGAIRALLQEYLVLVAQLEFQFSSRKLTLLRCWYYIQPALHSLTRLEWVCTKSQRASGGGLLNVLYSAWTSAGDEPTRKLYASLLQQASVPYMAMLRSWLTQGALSDLYDEFLIRADTTLRKENLRRDFNDTYWDEHYTLRTTGSSGSGSGGAVPEFLRTLADKILTAGKYLNVIRECGRTIPEREVVRAMQGLDDTADASAQQQAQVLHSYHPNADPCLLSDPIDRLSVFSSRLLLDLLMQECDLLGRLRSIKRYFLMSQGDFTTHFLDLAQEELSKPADRIHAHKVRSLLDLALKTTRASSDPYQESLGCFMQARSLVQNLEAIHNTNAAKGGAAAALASASKIPGGLGLVGHDSLTLSYHVSWPLSLVLNFKILSKYQLLYRHLLSIRHTERLLHTCWRDHQSAKGLGEEVGLAYRASFALRHRMLHLFHSLAYYIMAEVLEPAWHRLEESLASVTTVDQVLKHHAAFLDGCLRACLLTNQMVLKAIQKLIFTARHFAEHAELTMNAGMGAQKRRNIGGTGTQGAGNESDEEDAIAKRGSHTRKGSLAAADDSDYRSAPPTLQQRADTIAFNTRVTLAAIADPRHQDTIRAHRETFDENLAVLLANLRSKAASASSSQGDQAHFNNLLQRIDYNGWHADYFARNPTKSQQKAANTNATQQQAQAPPRR